ncbi:acyltransferase family protein [Spirillospora sp. NBC_01491]|uniref:acyltransferase family protein n=1 Tax=Spirillospora sp. NBC_01491 TaxID=2976007 RepID=UPI002E33F3B3|nr:acyltransferase [Spirillospora sp. NBC_01491]
MTAPAQPAQPVRPGLPVQPGLPAQAAAARLPAISGHQAALDGLRAVAALAVLVFHIAASTGYLTRPGGVAALLSRGEIGVPIFFTLSGLLLYRPWAAAALGLRRPPGTGPYLWKRALRLLPAYWLLVVVSTLLYSRDHLADVWHWVQTLTLTYNYDPHPWWNDHLGPKGMGQIWSLTVEAAFYVTLPPTAFVLGRWAVRAADLGGRARRLLYGIGAYSALAAVYVAALSPSADREFLGNWLPRYLAWFGVGMALAVLSVWANAEPGPDGPVRRFCRTVAGSWGLCWTAAGLFYCVASTPITGLSRLYEVNVWTSELQLVLYGLVAAFLVAPVALAPAAHPVTRLVLGNRAMAFLGKISYSIFLWQFVVIFVWFDVTGHPPFTGTLLIDLPVCAALTIALAALSHRLVEEPARRLGTRVLSRPRTRA